MNQVKREVDMNEQFKELAVKAKLEHCVSHVRLQEFAELILLECNMALQPYLRDMISRGQACDLINNHFGVE